MKNSRACANHTALAAGISRGAPSPPPPSLAPHQQRPPSPVAPVLHQPMAGPQPTDRGRQRKRGRNGSPRANSSGGQQPTPPWSAGYNPWTGVVHAYSMPLPRAPAPSLLGPRQAGQQAFFAAPNPSAQLQVTPATPRHRRSCHRHRHPLAIPRCSRLSRPPHIRAPTVAVEIGSWTPVRLLIWRTTPVTYPTPNPLPPLPGSSSVMVPLFPSLMWLRSVPFYFHASISS